MEHENEFLHVIETRGGFDLSGRVFIGDVKVWDEESGKSRWISGEHAEGDYFWGNLWKP